MKRKLWFHYYLLVMGSVILSLGLILVFRNLVQHRSYPGVLLGLAFVVYGALRLRQRRRFPMEK